VTVAANDMMMPSDLKCNENRSKFLKCHFGKDNGEKSKQCG